jgi:hypothetical protein
MMGEKSSAQGQHFYQFTISANGAVDSIQLIG